MQPWRHKLRELIFEADTTPGRWFDTVLITCILVSVAIAMLDSVAAISRIWGRWFYLGEGLFTILSVVPRATTMTRGIANSAVVLCRLARASVSVPKWSF